MKLKDPGKTEGKMLLEVNLTPMIDIMLVLLIVFMAASSLTLDSGLDIDIPKTKAETKPNPSDVVIISLNRDGGVFVQGKQTSDAVLEEAIKVALTEAKSETVIYEGDQGSKLGRAIEIMDIAKRAGAVKFAIAAESAAQ
jgi:biopolymer transport protein ExbD